MKVLITGFKPFNGKNINPSLEVLKRINHFDNFEIYKLELNVEYQLDSLLIINKIKEINPDFILLLGEAGGRSKISLEYCAININSASIVDNKNNLFIDKEIIKDGDISYKTNLDIFNIKDKVNDVIISYSCGTYVCNDIYYRTLNYIYKNNLNSKCCFIHLPFLKEQIKEKYKNLPYLELNEMVDTLYKIIENCE